MTTITNISTIISMWINMVPKSWWALAEFPKFLKSKVNSAVEHIWNVMAHAQKPDLVFQRNG